MEKILKSYIKKLSNISSNNRSLCLLKLHKEQFLDIHKLNFLNKQPSFSVIENLISGKSKIFLCDELDSRDFNVNDISKQLKKIQRRDKFIFEETGAKDVYIGWPFVKGKFADGSLVRCPLLFFPVTLELEQGKWHLIQKKDLSVSMNKSFLYAYSHFNKISISDEWIESSFEDFDKDILNFRTQLYEFLKESAVVINFNQDLFTNVLLDFKEYKSEEYSNLNENGELKLFSEAVLGIFPQASSGIIPDYEELIQRAEFEDFEGFCNSKIIRDENKSIKEETNYFAFQTNGSQEQVLESVKEGKSMVVQGPPGTGKSQLICNLISDFTARGKKVLLVCQKKAALDVVYNRLKSINIHPFIGLVHDYKNDRSVIFEQLSNQIDNIETYQKQNNGLDTVYLERNFIQASRQIKQSAGELDEFKNALYSTQDFGISAKELYLTSNPKGIQVSMKEFALRFNHDTALNFESKIQNFMPYALLFLKEGYTWKERVSFSEFYIRDRTNIAETVLAIPAYFIQLKESSKRKLKVNDDVFDVLFFKNNKKLAEKIENSIKAEEDFFILLELLKEKTNKEWISDKKKKVLACFSKIMPEYSLSINELEFCEGLIKKYTDSRKNIFTTLVWNNFSKDKKRLKEILDKNNLALSIEGVSALSKRIVGRKKFEKEKKSLKTLSWTHDFPDKPLLVEIENWFLKTNQLLEFKEQIVENEGVMKIIENADNEFEIFRDNFQLIGYLADDIQRHISQWHRYLSITMIERLLVGENSSESLIKDLERDFDKLVEFDKLQKQFLSFEIQILESILNHKTSETVSEKVELFRNSIRLEWLSFLEEKYPSLLIVSNLRLETLERELQISIENKKKLSCSILELKLREQTYRNIEYNRLQNRLTYRDLYHQVTKKKKLWPLRKIFQTFEEEIFQLIPCWLVSPESASALFPLNESFDLVIFDEASQCYSEYGLSAMYRAKQVVVAGDSKQLRPNNLYQVRWDNDDDEASVDLEMESLLDLSSKYFPSMMLTGHYRSKRLDLIDFSNRHFYKQSLSFVPYFENINNAEPSIQYKLVTGTWNQQTNATEAEALVKLALEEICRDKNQSIGVITFNYKQAQLILDILEQRSTEQQINIPDTLFVKNIENVQGDEKDIILFSLGYAPDSNGRFNMQFGSLNQEGGENRLNVAITRAKEKIILVASILPHQLLVEDALNEGPKLLKKYLQYAWDVSKGQYKPTPTSKIVHGKEWYLSKKLLELQPDKQLKYVEELPFADITVKKALKYYSLIRTDDHLYFETRNSKEGHAYIPLELKEKGWSDKIIFSRNYWLHQENATELL